MIINSGNRSIWLFKLGFSDEAFEAVDCNEKTLLDALPNAQPSEQLKPEDYIACEQPTTLAFVGAGKIDRYARRWVEQWMQAVCGSLRS